MVAEPLEVPHERFAVVGPEAEALAELGVPAAVHAGGGGGASAPI